MKELTIVQKNEKRKAFTGEKTNFALLEDIAQRKGGGKQA